MSEPTVQLKHLGEILYRLERRVVALETLVANLEHLSNQHDILVAGLTTSMSRMYQHMLRKSSDDAMFLSEGDT